MKKQKSISGIRENLMWLKRKELSHIPQDLLFALCMASIFVAMATFAIS